MLKNRFSFETENHGNVTDNTIGKTTYKLDSRLISRDYSHYPRHVVRPLQSSQTENKIQDQAVPEKYLSDINGLHSFAQTVAIQLPEACSILPFRHDLMALSVSETGSTPSSGLMSIMMDQPINISLQIHPQHVYRIGFGNNLIPIQLGYDFYDGTYSDDYSFRQTLNSQEKDFSDFSIASRQRKKSTSISQALLITPGILSTSEILAPQSFCRDFKLSYQHRVGVYLEASCDFSQTHLKSVTKRVCGYSRGKISDSRSLSLPERVSMENLNEFGHSFLEKKSLKVKKALMKKRRGRDVKSANDVALTHRYNPGGVDIASAGFRSNETSPAKSFTNVYRPKSGEIPSINVPVDLMALDDGLDHYAKSPRMITKASEISAKAFLLPPMAPIHKKNKQRKNSYKESIVSEVSPSDYRLYEISDPWQRNTLSAYGSASGSPIGYCMSLTGSVSSPPPLFFKREDRKGSTSQISVPDDFSANVVHYGERSILSLIGSSCSSSMSAFPSPYAKIYQKRIRSDTSKSASEEDLSQKQNQTYPTIEIESLTDSEMPERTRLGTKDHGFETGGKSNIQVRSVRRKEMTIF